MRRWLLVLLTGVGVLAGVPVWLVATAPADAVGAVDAAVDGPAAPATDEPATEDPAGDDPATGAPAAGEPVTVDSASRPRSPDPPPDRRAARPAVRPARLADLQPADDIAPVGVTVDAIGVDAQVVAVGVDADGAMAVPDDGALVGWYEHGVPPGQAPGSAVLAGHVDTDEGPGAFVRLGEVKVGAEVGVDLADGSRVRYEVVARRRYPKEELPVRSLFARDGGHRLVLVTCGGAWDAQRRRYADNVVVWAVPAR